MLQNGAGTVLYLVPGGRTALIKGVAIDNDAGPSGTIVFYVQTVGGTFAGIHKQVVAAGSWQLFQFAGSLVLNPGDRLWAASPTGQAKGMLFGTLLLGSPA